MGDSRKTAFPTLFLGEYEHALDPQCRVTLPSEWRNKDGGTNLVLIPARDEALLLLPIETFMEFVERARKYAIANARMQAAFAYLGSQARNCRCWSVSSLASRMSSRVCDGARNGQSGTPLRGEYIVAGSSSVAEDLMMPQAP